jgi:thiamine biosynthesis protein ThiC
MSSKSSSHHASGAEHIKLPGATELRLLTKGLIYERVKAIQDDLAKRHQQEQRKKTHREVMASAQ